MSIKKAKKAKKTTKKTQQKQGDEFEDIFREFLKRLVCESVMEYKFELCEPRKQGSGEYQYGYDIRLKWKDSDGVPFNWAFECKSHKAKEKKQIPSKEFADKILSIYAHSTFFHCFCLVSCEREFDNNVCDNLIPYLNKKEIGSYIIFWTPVENCIKKCFEIYGDLYERIYNDKSPRLEQSEKEGRLKELKTLFYDFNLKGIMIGQKYDENLKTIYKRMEGGKERITDLTEGYRDDIESINLQIKFRKA